MCADVGGRSHLGIFLTEFEHRKTKFCELLVLICAYYFHFFQTIGIARKGDFLAWLGYDGGEGVVGIDQSEE